MKRTIFLSLIFLCLFRVATFAQDGINSGNFTLDQNGTSIQASYTIMPAAPDNIVLQIRPSGEFVLNAHIISANGEELLKIDTETVNLRYAKSIDISALAPGSYYIEVLGENADQNYKIPFSKS